LKREARLLAGPNSAEERLEGPIETLQRHLGRLGVYSEIGRVLLADRGEVPALVRIGDRYASHAVRLDALLKCGVVQRAVQVVQTLERRQLRP
jgi:hypothetical protein